MLFSQLKIDLSVALFIDDLKAYRAISLGTGKSEQAEVEAPILLLGELVESAVCKIGCRLSQSVSFEGRLVRLKFYLENARIFSFGFPDD